MPKYRRAKGGELRRVKQADRSRTTHVDRWHAESDAIGRWRVAVGYLTSALRSAMAYGVGTARIDDMALRLWRAGDDLNNDIKKTARRAADDRANDTA